MREEMRIYVSRKLGVSWYMHDADLISPALIVACCRRVCFIERTLEALCDNALYNLILCIFIHQTTW